MQQTQVARRRGTAATAAPQWARVGRQADLHRPAAGRTMVKTRLSRLSIALGFPAGCPQALESVRIHSAPFVEGSPYPTISGGDP